jgi:hypothetical protein
MCHEKGQGDGSQYRDCSSFCRVPFHDPFLHSLEPGKTFAVV